MLDCPPGEYCNGDGLHEPTSKCPAGHYCTGKSTFDGVTVTNGGPCPKGHYCEEGSDHPQHCQSGTYNPESGKSSIDDCLPCPPSKFCEGHGLSSYSGPCAAGYYCPGGQKVERPVEYVCQKGFRCPGGTSAPIACDGDNEYQDEIG